MTSRCEVDIPTYLKSLGFKEQIITIPGRADHCSGYEVCLYREDAFVAGLNLPWTVSLTTIYRIFLIGIGFLSEFAGCQCIDDWARRQVVQMGRDELQSFFDAQKEKNDPNFVHKAFEQSKTFYYIVSEIA